MSVHEMRAKQPLDLNNIKSFFTSKRSLHQLASTPEQLRAAAKGLMDFAALDQNQQGLRLTVGEIAYKFLSLPLDEQQPVVEALAKEMGLKPPSYEGATTGRIQFAHTLYGHQPSLLKVGESGKDTLAAKRVSEYIRLYRIEKGLATVAEASEKGAPARTMRLALGWLWSVVETPAEEKAILGLYAKLGLERERVEGWLEVEPTPATETVKRKAA